MTDQPAPPPEEEVRPFIKITFVEQGSAIFDLEIQNPVIPQQILMVAAWLKIVGESQVLQQQLEAMQREAQSKIAIPKGNLKL